MHCLPGLEIATILVPHWFLALGSVANMVKGLSWMAGGSTRSVFNLSFVRDNNIAGARAHTTQSHSTLTLTHKRLAGRVVVWPGWPPPGHNAPLMHGHSYESSI
jgi:Vitamin B6 photo-protection and homoeostasis